MCRLDVRVHSPAPTRTHSQWWRYNKEPPQHNEPWIHALSPDDSDTHNVQPFRKKMTSHHRKPTKLDPSLLWNNGSHWGVWLTWWNLSRSHCREDGVIASLYSVLGNEAHPFAGIFRDSVHLLKVNGVFCVLCFTYAAGCSQPLIQVQISSHITLNCGELR